jgi:hypothetical protein
MLPADPTERPEAPGSLRARLKWRTLNDQWETTTTEGWQYRVRYRDGRFVSVSVQSTGAEAFVWTCASLAQAKFSVFADVRRRRETAAARSAPLVPEDGNG